MPPTFRQHRRARRRPAHPRGRATWPRPPAELEDRHLRRTRRRPRFHSLLPRGRPRLRELFAAARAGSSACRRASCALYIRHIRHIRYINDLNHIQPTERRAGAANTALQTRNKPMTTSTRFPLAARVASAVLATLLAFAANAESRRRPRGGNPRRRGSRSRCRAQASRSARMARHRPRHDRDGLGGIRRLVHGSAIDRRGPRGYGVRAEPADDPQVPRRHVRQGPQRPLGRRPTGQCGAPRQGPGRHRPRTRQLGRRHHRAQLPRHLQPAERQPGSSERISGRG